MFLGVHMCRLGCHVDSSAMMRNPELSEQSSVFAERARRWAVLGRAARCSVNTLEFIIILAKEVCPTLIGVSFESGVQKMSLFLNPLAMFTAPLNARITLALCVNRCCFCRAEKQI